MNKQLAKDLRDWRANFVRLANKPLTMSNYKELMRSYLQEVLQFADLVIEVADAVDSLSDRPVIELSVESKP